MKISVEISGPPGSGKSSLAARLKAVFREFDLSCRIEDEVYIYGPAKDCADVIIRTKQTE